MRQGKVWETWTEGGEEGVENQRSEGSRDSMGGEVSERGKRNAEGQGNIMKQPMSQSKKTEGREGDAEKSQRQQSAAGRGPGIASPQHVTEHRWGRERGRRKERREWSSMLFNLLSASKSYSPLLLFSLSHSLSPRLQGWNFPLVFCTSLSLQECGWLLLPSCTTRGERGGQDTSGCKGVEERRWQDTAGWPAPQKGSSDCLTHVLFLNSPHKQPQSLKPQPSWKP